MGLKLALRTTSGYDAEYHRFAQVLIDFHNQAVEAVCYIYKDKASRDSGAEPAVARKFNWKASECPIPWPFSSEELAKEGASPLKACYTMFKTEKGLEGAEDA